MTWEAAADRLLHEYDEEIELLRRELCHVEDCGHSVPAQRRALAIRSRIRDLEFERDLLPRPRQP